MSGMSFLCGLRASVESFPMYVAFPRSEYYARYDSPYAYGRLSLLQYSSAYLACFPHRSLGSSIVPSPGFPFRASIAVYPPPTLPTRRSLWGLPSSSTYLFLHATACGLRRTSYILTHNGCFVLASGTLKPSPSATSLSRSCTSSQGTRLPLRPTGFSVYASPVLFANVLLTPPQAQDSIRVDG